jgi:hypothetical protein
VRPLAPSIRRSSPIRGCSSASRTRSSRRSRTGTARGADLIEAALATGTELYVNEMANIDSDAYRILAGLTV